MGQHDEIDVLETQIAAFTGSMKVVRLQQEVLAAIKGNKQMSAAVRTIP